MRIPGILTLALVIAAPAFAQTEATCPPGAEDVRLAALSGLAQMDGDQVMPVMKKILERRDTCSISLRRQVLGFMTRQRFGDQSDVLLGVVRSDPSPEVRRYAVQVLALGNSARAMSLMDSIQPDLRETLVRAIAARHSPETTIWLLAMARDKNRDIDSRRLALSAVGQAVRANETSGTSNGDLQAVLGLYDAFAGQIEMQDRALDVIAQRPESIATDKLLQIARSETNLELRRKAILRVGQRRDPRVRDFLLDVLSK